MEFGMLAKAGLQRTLFLHSAGGWKGGSAMVDGVDAGVGNTNC